MGEKGDLDPAKEREVFEATQKTIDLTKPTIVEIENSETTSAADLLSIYDTVDGAADELASLSEVLSLFQDKVFATAQPSDSDLRDVHEANVIQRELHGVSLTAKKNKGKLYRILWQQIRAEEKDLARRSQTKGTHTN